MAATKLRLRNDRIGFGKTTVYVQYVYKSKNYYFSTNEKIEPDPSSGLPLGRKLPATRPRYKTLMAAY